MDDKLIQAKEKRKKKEKKEKENVKKKVFKKSSEVQLRVHTCIYTSFTNNNNKTIWHSSSFSLARRVLRLLSQLVLEHEDFTAFLNELRQL